MTAIIRKENFPESVIMNDFINVANAWNVIRDAVQMYIIGGHNLFSLFWEL